MGSKVRGLSCESNTVRDNHFVKPAPCLLLLFAEYTLAGSDGYCVCVPPPSGSHHSGDGEATLLHP